MLYGYAPEVFPTPRRGTGDAFAAASSRITGLFAPSKFMSEQFFSVESNHICSYCGLQQCRKDSERVGLVAISGIIDMFDRRFFIYQAGLRQRDYLHSDRPCDAPASH